MKIIEPSYEILTPISTDGVEELAFLERVARTCYKSEDMINGSTDATKSFIERLIFRGHEAMLEHASLSVKFIVDRGVSHELVRHRMASFAQESTRFCNYSRDKFGGEITVIRPYYLDDDSDAMLAWTNAMRSTELSYFKMLNEGCSPQQARTVLPNSLKTEIVVTANYREWRHILKLRTAKDAHPQMIQVMAPLLKELQNRIPIIFDGIGESAWDDLRKRMGLSITSKNYTDNK